MRKGVKQFNIINESLSSTSSLSVYSFEDNINCLYISDDISENKIQLHYSESDDDLSDSNNDEFTYDLSICSQIYMLDKNFEKNYTDLDLDLYTILQ
jgi:hypothetical protein